MTFHQCQQPGQHKHTIRIYHETGHDCPYAHIKKEHQGNSVFVCIKAQLSAKPEAEDGKQQAYNDYTHAACKSRPLFKQAGQSCSSHSWSVVKIPPAELPRP